MNSHAEEILSRVKSEIGNAGESFLDWGITSDIYRNCVSRNEADQIALLLKADGYDIFIERMGYGSSRIPKGTPVCYRIFKNRFPSRPLDEWNP